MKKEKLWWRKRGLDRMEERFGNKIVKFVKQRLKTEKTVRILEIGFGEGKCLLELGAMFPQVELYGINELKAGKMRKKSDFAENAKLFGIKPNKNLPKPYFYDAGKGLKFDDGYFDVVISQVAIHYVGNKFKLYEEIWRVLKKGGKAFLHVDRTRVPELPEHLRVKTETPLHIVYRGDELIPLKKLIAQKRKEGHDISLVWDLPKKKQRSILMTKNMNKKLDFDLKYDSKKTVYLTKQRDDDPSKAKPGIWWGTRSVFHVKSK